MVLLSDTPFRPPTWFHTILINEKNHLEETYAKCNRFKAATFVWHKYVFNKTKTHQFDLQPIFLFDLMVQSHFTLDLSGNKIEDELPTSLLSEVFYEYHR